MSQFVCKSETKGDDEMKKTIKIVASNKQEAFSIGEKKMMELLGKKIKKNNLSIIEIKNKKGFPGFRKKKEFQIIYEDTLSKKDEEFLEMVIEDIDTDGNFKVKVADDGIFLKVSAPQGRGKAVSIVDVNSIVDKKE